MSSPSPASSSPSSPSPPTSPSPPWSNYSSTEGVHQSYCAGGAKGPSSAQQSVRATSSPAPSPARPVVVTGVTTAIAGGWPTAGEQPGGQRGLYSSRGPCGELIYPNDDFSQIASYEGEESRLDQGAPITTTRRGAAQRAGLPTYTFFVWLLISQYLTLTNKGLAIRLLVSSC
jgi:hypothetical protein